MSGKGHPTVDLTMGCGDGLRVAVVASSWNKEITDLLLDNAVGTAEYYGADVTVIRVVGALELPIVVKAATISHDAVVALGCVIQGDTPHFEHVSNAVTYGLTKIALETDTPVGNGVLTCNTLEQAQARSGGPDSVENKGEEAAVAAIHTALTLAEMD